MLDKRKISAVTGILIAGLSLSHPKAAYAWGRDEYRHGHYRRFEHVHHPYPQYGRAIAVFPTKYFTIVIGGSRFYYCDGIFYHRNRHNYVVVAPPRGAIVVEIPVGCERVVMNGVEYYRDDNIYYRRTFNGYEVVSPPEITTFETAKHFDNALSVNIPNRHGGYTEVTLKKDGSGYTGPQGEYYSEFPSVEQLKAMYAK